MPESAVDYGYFLFSVAPASVLSSCEAATVPRVVTGVVAEPGKETFTITAKQAVTMADASTTLTIASEGERGRLE